MWKQCSAFQKFSSMRSKYFLELENEEEAQNSKNKNQKVNQTLQMSKSSESIFGKKNFIFQKKQNTQEQLKPFNVNKKWEMEALLIDQSQQEGEQSKNIFSVISRSGKDKVEGKEKTGEERMKEQKGNKRSGGGIKDYIEKQKRQKEKIENSTGFSEDLTEAFTPSAISDKFSDDCEKDGENQKKQFIIDQKNNEKLLLKNQLKLDDFLFIKKIGRGVQGEVHLALHKKTGMIIALKKIYKEYLKNEKHRENLFRQIKIHLHLSHKNIIKLYAVFNDSSNVYMVLEPMLDGDLWSIKKKFHHISEKNVAKIVFNICKGLKYLHEKDIFHRDIKLQNILLTEGIAKLGDFGCAVHSFCMRKSSIGSPNYLSPEQIGNHFYNKKVDIWSIGIITYQLLFGESPFEKQIENSFKNHVQIPHFKLTFPQSIKISQQAEDFLKKTLEKNANLRIDVGKVMKHPFLKKKTMFESPI